MCVCVCVRECVKNWALELEEELWRKEQELNLREVRKIVEGRWNDIERSYIE